MAWKMGRVGQNWPGRADCYPIFAADDFRAETRMNQLRFSEDVESAEF